MSFDDPLEQVWKEARKSIVRDSNGFLIHFKCRFCNKNIVRQDYFKLHIHRQHYRELGIEKPTKSYVCPFEQCIFNFYSNRELKLHINNKHAQKTRTSSTNDNASEKYFPAKAILKIIPPQGKPQEVAMTGATKPSNAHSKVVPAISSLGPISVPAFNFMKSATSTSPRMDLIHSKYIQIRQLNQHNLTPIQTNTSLVDDQIQLASTSSDISNQPYNMKLLRTTMPVETIQVTAILKGQYPMSNLKKSFHSHDSQFVERLSDDVNPINNNDDNCTDQINTNDDDNMHQMKQLQKNKCAEAVMQVVSIQREEKPREQQRQHRVSDYDSIGSSHVGGW